MSISNQIKKLRKKLGLSQEELSRKAEITYSTLIKIESGANDNPTIKTLKNIADALDTKVDNLIK
ncbi:MAG: helix-turn-helix transcriptional regulator [Candidatus Saganbacteria bacterium]|nr:helix-turn-helix transcriptional regulator [Candidatus Saganbacteria bacterium]